MAMTDMKSILVTGHDYQHSCLLVPATEPVIRVMVEAGTHDECEAYVDEVIEVIKSKGYVAG